MSVLRDAAVCWIRELASRRCRKIRRELSRQVVREVASHRASYPARVSSGKHPDVGNSDTHMRTFYTPTVNSPETEASAVRE